MIQKAPQRMEAPIATSNPASFVFLHGYGDDADGWTNIAEQFHAASKLPHLSWIFPNAPFDNEAMSTAWYPVANFSPIPVGRSSSSAEAEGDDEGSDDDGEDEILQSAEYVCSLIDNEVSKGVKPERIVVGGFSQGCAVALVTALASRYQGRLAGVVGLSGYLPKGAKIREGRSKYVQVKRNDGRSMQVFLAHGTKDMLVPIRLFRDAKKRVEGTVGMEVVESHEYSGLGHVTSGEEFRDMSLFLEKIIPETDV